MIMLMKIQHGNDDNNNNSINNDNKYNDANNYDNDVDGDGDDDNYFDDTYDNDNNTDTNLNIKLMFLDGYRFYTYKKTEHNIMISFYYFRSGFITFHH